MDQATADMLFYLGLAVLAIIAVIVGILCSSIADQKGHSTGGPFWLGFFLGVIGLLYCIGLPDRKRR